MAFQKVNGPELKKALEVLIKEFHPEKIYLFGSKARGTSNSDSDYDIMLVLHEGQEKEPKSEEKACQLLWNAQIHIAMDVLITTKEYFKKRLNLQSSLPATIVREGQELYIAA